MAGQGWTLAFGAVGDVGEYSLTYPPHRRTTVHDHGYFDEPIAATYDDDASIYAPEVIDPVVGFLAGPAGDGRALEFGIGTGRIALPLAERGVPVHGIDLSKAMVARLRAKPGAAGIGVTIGDFATTTVEGSFTLVYLVFNTINNLTTQAAQVACFRNAAAHLEPGGCFVIEVGIPELRRLPPGETYHSSTSARMGGGSTSTTSPPRSSPRITSESETARSHASRSRSGMCGLPGSI
jgi:SAM-dependent methyltransferase